MFAALPDDAVDDCFFTEKNECKDIDYCIIGKCGKHGTCRDGHYSYTCDCEEGYEKGTTEDGYETCEEIDECDTQEGSDRCAHKGTCEDKHLKYECLCDEGYENRMLDGLDSCAPVECGAPDKIPNAYTRLQGKKLSFRDVAPYTCVTGHTIAGAIDGAISFETVCQADKTFSDGEECMPVDCPPLPEVKYAESNVSALKFPEAARYKCEDGYTLSGVALSEDTFVVECDEEGTLSATSECLPISCGAPPSIKYASFEPREVFYTDKVTYSCWECYSTTGEAGSPNEFEVECGIDGHFSKSKQCIANSCGRPDGKDWDELREIAGFPSEEYTCGRNFEVACNEGYTVD